MRNLNAFDLFWSVSCEFGLEMEELLARSFGGVAGPIMRGRRRLPSKLRLQNHVLDMG